MRSPYVLVGVHGPYLPRICGMTPTLRPGFDAEEWDTGPIGGLEEGAVFAFADEQPVHPLALTAIRANNPVDGFVAGTGRYVDDGEPATFAVRAATIVLVRRDLHYTPSEGVSS